MSTTMLTYVVAFCYSPRMKKPESRKAPKTKQHVIGVRVSDQLKADIERAAAEERRSVSQWLALAAEEKLERRK